MMVPPMAGMIFAVTFAFMLLFPFLRLSLDGGGEPETLLFLTKTDFGFNIFALILFLVPIVGVAVSMTLKNHAALLIDAVLSLIGVIMIPLTLMAAGREAGQDALLRSHVSPGVGFIFVSVMMVGLLISTAGAAFQTRH
jgi:hypothetical protein